MSQYSTRKYLSIALVILLALFSFFAVFSYRYMKKSVEETNTVNTTLQSLRVLEDIMDDVQYINNRFQGYMLAGNPILLQSYYDAGFQYPGMLQRSKHFTGSIPTEKIHMNNCRAEPIKRKAATCSTDYRQTFYRACYCIYSGSSVVVLENVPGYKNHAAI